MAKLDLDWLGVFVEVYRTQSVTRAAERLGLTQAAASTALGKLRRHFDDPLFTRTARGMAPTPRADAIYPELSEALARIEAARGARSAFDPARTARSFRLCITDISEIVLLPTLVNALRRTAPKVSLDVEKISTDSPLRLQSGEVDLAIGFMPDLEAGFYQQTLFMQDYVCLAAAGHPRIAGALTREAFAAESHIVVTSSGTGHAIVDKVLAREGIERRVFLRLPSYLSVARIVARTELLVVVPRLVGDSFAAQEAVQVLDPPIALPSYAVKQHWHERFHADAGNAWLRGVMAELFGRGAQAAVGPGGKVDLPVFEGHGGLVAGIDALSNRALLEATGDGS